MDRGFDRGYIRTMTLPDFHRVRKIWDDRKISGFVLLSLSLQILLTVCAPLRKRTSYMYGIVSLIIWSAYLLADLVANFAIGLIASSQDGGFKRAQAKEVYLLAFWAPFLLIHLGGPDTITSFALKDNALWLRHLLGPLFQVVATLNVFVKSLGPKNKLRFPTLALFLIGTIKCAERTRALYLGNKLVSHEYRRRNNVARDLQPPSDIIVFCGLFDRHPYHENNIGVVQCAYDFFQRFSKVLIADLLCTSSRDSTQFASISFFGDRSPEESFNIIAAELNFIYETLFTKLYVAHTKLGCFFRAMSFGVTSIALVCFNKLDKYGLDRFDVVITYTLICGAMALDSISLFMLIFSDWTVAFAAPKDLPESNNSWQRHCWETILLKYLDLKSTKWYSSNTRNSFLGWSRQILFGRCSESIYAFNLIDYALKESSPPTSFIGQSCSIFYLKTIALFRGCQQCFRQPSSSGGIFALGDRVNPTQFIAPNWGSFFGLKDLLDEFKYRSSKPLSKDLWEFIFNDLREKKNNREGYLQLWEARGDWILRYNHNYGDCTGLLRYVTHLDYEESLIVWHIATELCYNNTDKSKSKSKSNAGVDNRRREYSKTLSDYMLYLLFMQPSMMTSVTRIGQEALSDTCAIAQIFFRENSEPRLVLEHGEACKRILEASPSIRNKYRIFTGASKPQFLFLARDLAEELTKLEDKKWDLMSQMWVELLSYAATHCRPKSYAHSLSKGGELVAFVWLVMVHLDVGPM